MPTQIILGKGSSLEMSTTSGGTYTALQQAVSITGPSAELEMIDQAHLASKLKKQRPGLHEAPTLTLTVYHDPTDAGHVDLIAAMQGTTPNWIPTLRWFKLKLKNPDDGSLKATCSFPAWVNNYDGDAIEVGSNVTANFTLTLDDFPTWA